MGTSALTWAIIRILTTKGKKSRDRGTVFFVPLLEMLEYLAKKGDRGTDVILI